MAEHGIDARAILAAASAEAGSFDFGDGRFIEGLDRYVTALHDDAGLGPMGSAIVAAELQGLLVNRLRFQADLRRHPEILDEEIRQPLFILGLMRTGTTKLQQLIAQDPLVMNLPFWRVSNLAPIPGADPQTPDPRLALAEASVQGLSELAPDLMAAHPAQALEPEEEAFIMRLTFEAVANGMFDHVPSYLAWQAEQDQHLTYEYLRSMLQYVQWQDGGGRGRSWVLKTPMHLPYVDVLLDVFPDATVVHTHRDPRTAVASTLRTYEVLWTARDNRFGPEEIRAYARFWAAQMNTYLGKREKLRGRLDIVDIDYDSVVESPISAVLSIYEAWGRTLTPDAEARMTAWDKEKPAHRFGKHSYSLEQYGLTGPQIDEMFESYLTLFTSVRGS